MSEKARHTALVTVIAIQTAAIIWLGTSLYWARGYIELSRENRQLLLQTVVKQEEVYAIKLRLGEAYRLTLHKLLDGLGVIDDGRLTAAGMILEAYGETPTMPSVKALVKARHVGYSGGIGGGGEGE